MEVRETEAASIAFAARDVKDALGKMHHLKQQRDNGARAPKYVCCAAIPACLLVTTVFFLLLNSQTQRYSTTSPSPSMSKVASVIRRSC